MVVKAKRIGWNERLTPEQELDLDSYESASDDLEGDLQVIEANVPGVKPFKVYLVGGQEADPETITTES